MCYAEATAAEWLFYQEKATLHCSQKVYMYSENALVARPAPQAEAVALSRQPLAHGKLPRHHQDPLDRMPDRR